MNFNSNSRTNTFERRRNNNHNIPSTQIRGRSKFYTKKHSLKDFPEFIIKDISKLEEGNRKCRICLDEFNTSIKVVSLPCFHFFHKICIEKWIKNKKRCPLCNFELTKENLMEKNRLLTS